MTKAQVASVGLNVGEAIEDWTDDARFFEYTSAANPVGRTIELVPVRSFPADLHHNSSTAVIPLDLSKELGLETGPATSPALLANFVKILAGETLQTRAQATSELFVVISGSGSTARFDEHDNQRALTWKKGDVFVLPAGGARKHSATSDATLYWVTDEPLLTYLGVTVSEPRFTPTLFTAERCSEELLKVAAEPAAGRRNRISVLLNQVNQDQTLTVTHVLWAMVGLLPAGAVQKPHRHQSVALDLILNCSEGCYSLVGPRLGNNGEILDAQRVDWEPEGAFVTPPGWWHAHYNTSGEPAFLLPVQDAGLHTYLRSLDIRFT